MANRIKGITVEIGGDTTKLQSALKGVDSQIKNTQSQLKDVEKLLNLDPGNTELLSQKYKLVSQAVEETRKRLATLKEANDSVSESAKNYDAWKAEFDPVKSKIDETKQKITELKKAMQSLETAGKIDTEEYQKLQQELKETTSECKELQQEAKEISDAFGNPINPEQYDALQREIIETEAELKKLEKTEQEIALKSSDVGQLATTFDNIGNKCDVLASKFQGLSLAATAALAAIGAVAVKAGQTADDLNTVSKQTGLSTEELQKFNYASELIDVSLSDIATGLKRTEKAMSTNSSVLSELGVQITDTNGEMRGSEEVFFDIIDALGKVENETQRDIYAQTLFGKSFQNLNPLIEDGTDALRDLYAEADNTGLILSQEQIDSANAFNDSLDRIKGTCEQGLFVVGARFSEIFGPAIDDLSGKLAQLFKTVSNLPTPVLAVITGFTGLVAATYPVLKIVGEMSRGFSAILTLSEKFPEIMGTLSGVLSTVKGAFSALFSVLASNPIIIVIAAISALVLAFVYLWNNCEDFRNFWINLWEDIKRITSIGIEKIKGFFSGIIEFVQNNWQNILLFLVNPFAGGFKLLYDNCEQFRAFIDSFLNRIKESLLNTWQNINENTYNSLILITGYLYAKFTEIYNNACTWISKVKDAIDQKHSEISTNVSTKWAEIRDDTSYKLYEMYSSAIAWFKNMHTDIVSSVGNIRASIENGFSNAVSYIANLPSQAWEWGYDLIAGFISGIKAAKDDLVETVYNTASSVRSYLHFSRPDVGPLRDYETWMPDFIHGMAKGIMDNKSIIEKAVNSLSSSMDFSTSLGFGNVALPSSRTISNSLINHTGTIRVEGVNNNNELSGIVDIVIDKLRQEVRL